MKKVQVIRWTVEAAASEFGKGARTIVKRLKRDGVVAGTDGRYSTLQIAGAIFSRLDEAKLRKAEAEAGLAEIELLRERENIVDVETVIELWDNILMPVKRVILKSTLPHEDQDAILRELQKCYTYEEYIAAKRANNPDEAQSQPGGLPEAEGAS